MNYSLISFEVEQKVKKEIKELFEFDVIEKIINQAKVDETGNRFKQIHEGMSFKISKELSPKNYELVQEILQRLEFDEPVEVFIMNSSETNAYAIPKGESDDSHIIVISSETIKLFDDEELRFIIGHEIGHLISGYSKISRVINFVYPPGEEIPSVILNKVSFWQKLAELTADRYGFISSPKLEKAISVFFKLSSGLDTQKISFNYEAYLREISELIKSYEENPTIMIGSHPINPIRIKCLEHFANSELFGKIKLNEELKNDKILLEKVNKLAELMTVISDSAITTHRSYFLASGGLLMAMVDGQLSELEHARIIAMLGNFNMFPNLFLSKIVESDNIIEIFQDSVQKILDLNPGERYPMLDYLIDIIVADHQIEEKEIKLLTEISNKNLGISNKETAQRIASKIRDGFVPKFYYT